MEVRKNQNKSQIKKYKMSKFEQFLKMDMGQQSSVTAQEDLELERKLAKKLKVKKGKKRSGPLDGLDDLFEGFDTGADFDAIEEEFEDKKEKRKRKDKKVQNEESDQEKDHPVSNKFEENTADQEDGSVKKKRKRNKKKELESRGVEKEMEEKTEEKCEEKSKEIKPVKYVAPHLRSCANTESEEISQMRRRIRGLLNRLSESNVESITQEVASIFSSIARNVGCQLIGDEVLASCSRGPRGNEQYAAVFGAFVAGMACLVGIDFGAKLVASLAKLFEEEYSKEESLSLRNITLLLCYLCVFGVVSSDLLYDLLTELSKSLTELDVATILAILQCCGMKLRSEDPTSMKDFVLSIQNRVNELKSNPNSTQDEKTKINSKRMEFMLETICDIKNNKKRSKEDPAHHTRLKKWLQKLRSEEILLRGLKWKTLLNPDKKGQWWLSGELVGNSSENLLEPSRNLVEVSEAQRLVQLATAQRMNTDLRRAIFCIAMSGEDYLDAFEKLLRLDLSGKQDREIMRVLVHCCLHEKTFNKYYTLLASKLCSHNKNHKFSLQYCLWDHFKELESMDLTKSMNLAKFITEMLVNFSLSLAILKPVEFADPARLSAKRVMCFRMVFEFLLEREDELVWNVFSRVAGLEECEGLRKGVLFFVGKYVVGKNGGLERKFRVVKKALDNVAGVLM
ncbi:hypothetical protein LUZ60_006639 [Juncus effusus]|nr:hypothetical protein LUZ60_006639 [Juncus effusus]